MALSALEVFLHVVAGISALMGVLVFVLVRIDRIAPIPRAFKIGTAHACFMFACLLEYLSTKQIMWVYAMILCAAFMHFYIGLSFCRWWRKWGPA